MLIAWTLSFLYQVASLRCWSGVYPYVTLSKEDHNGGYCASAMDDYYGAFYWHRDFKNTSWPGMEYFCETDYCNIPTNFPTNALLREAYLKVNQNKISSALGAVLPKPSDTPMRTTLKCWEGTEPIVRKSLIEQSDAGYCVRIRAHKESDVIRYSYVGLADLMTFNQSILDLIDPCHSDYCNTPIKTTKADFVPKITISSSPSNVYVKCWENMEGQSPKKSALARGIGYCAIITYFYRNQTNVLYRFVAPELNDWFASGECASLVEYVSCNGFYCNDPVKIGMYVICTL